MTDPSPSDKRIESRAITDVAMEVYDMASHELVGIGRLLNLSSTGALVETTAEFGDRPNLFVRMLLNNRLVAAPVTLMWEKPGPNKRLYGLKFGPTSEEMQEIIKA